MPLKEKARQDAEPIPEMMSLQDSPESKSEIIDRQADRLARLYSFCQETALAIAVLAYAGGPR